jgi:hypothetical protein
MRLGKKRRRAVTLGDMTRPRPPQSLDQAGRALWRAVMGAYVLAPHEVELLRQACRVTDQLARIDAVLMDEDLVVAGHAGQPRAHPMLQVSADQRRVLDALFRSMALPMPGETEGRRRSPSAAAAAQARWRGQRNGQMA